MGHEQKSAKTFDSYLDVGTFPWHQSLGKSFLLSNFVAFSNCSGIV